MKWHGSLFQTQGTAATGKARSPTVDSRVRRTISWRWWRWAKTTSSLEVRRPKKLVDEVRWRCKNINDLESPSASYSSSSPAVFLPSCGHIRMPVTLKLAIPRCGSPCKWGNHKLVYALLCDLSASDSVDRSSASPCPVHIICATSLIIVFADYRFSKERYTSTN